MARPTGQRPDVPDYLNPATEEYWAERAEFKRHLINERGFTPGRAERYLRRLGHPRDPVLGIEVGAKLALVLIPVAVAAVVFALA